MEMNFSAILAAALFPLIIGLIWYGPLFGKIWRNENGFTEHALKKGSKLKTYVLIFIFSILFAFIMQMLVIHQFGALGMTGGEVTMAKQSYVDFMADYGTAFRTYKHGALHGFMS